MSVAEAGSAFINAGLISPKVLESVVAKMQRANDDPNILALMSPMTQVSAIKASQI